MLWCCWWCSSLTYSKTERIHTMHRVLFRTPTTWVCFVFIRIHTYIRMWWYDDVHFWYSDAMYPCCLSHVEGANSLHMVLFSSLLRLSFVSHNIHHYSSSESLVFSFQSHVHMLSMDQRPETRTFSRLLHQL